jgi:hypothetical protein
MSIRVTVEQSEKAPAISIKADVPIARAPEIDAIARESLTRLKNGEILALPSRDPDPV